MSTQVANKSTPQEHKGHLFSLSLEKPHATLFHRKRNAYNYRLRNQNVKQTMWKNGLRELLELFKKRMVQKSRQQQHYL